MQNTNVTNISQYFLTSIDKIARSATKEILHLPADTPDSILYSARKFKGLGLWKSEWEAPLQRLNICHLLERDANEYVLSVSKLPEERKLCIKRLHINQPENAPPLEDLQAKSLRTMLRKQEYDKWCNLRIHGKGAILYQEYTPANRWIENLNGLSSSEWREALKMQYNVVPVRTLPGRSRDGVLCRHCREPETLGSCSRGDLLRNSRHNRIRSKIASAFSKKGYEVYEEVPCIALQGGSRRIDIIAIDRKNNSAFILDPTIRSETDSNQPEAVNIEKKDIYDSTVPYFQEKYKINNISVIGLFIGARGTIPKFLVKFFKSVGIPNSVCLDLAILSIKGSIQIIRNHLHAK